MSLHQGAVGGSQINPYELTPLAALGWKAGPRCNGIASLSLRARTQGTRSLVSSNQVPSLRWLIQAWPLASPTPQVLSSAQSTRVKGAP